MGRRWLVLNGLLGSAWGLHNRKRASLPIYLINKNIMALL
jgi:hypothetical protein